MPLQPRNLRMVNASAHALGIAGLLAIALGTWLVAYRPLRAKQEHYLAQRERLQSQLGNSDAVLAARDALRETFVNLESRADAARRRIPEQENEAEFLQFLTHVAKEHGVEIRDYRRDRIAHTDTHSELHIGLKGVGSYSAVCRMLHDIQQAERLVTVARLDLLDEPVTDRHAIEMTLVLYFGIREIEPAAGREDAGG